MGEDELDAETIGKITRDFSRVFDHVAQEPATAEVPGLVSVSVDSSFRVSQVTLANGVLDEELRNRMESAITTVVNQAYEQMTMRHADALRSTVLEFASPPRRGPKE